MKFSLLKDREGETQRDKQTERGGEKFTFFLYKPRSNKSYCMSLKQKSLLKVGIDQL